MDFIKKYISEYAKNFEFDFSKHISTGVSDIKIEIDLFEYNSQYNHREKAHVVFKKGDIKYECDFYDRHDYKNGFYPIVLNSKHFICFRKTLYGFTFINAETLAEEYEYFPECVLHDEESLIITDVKQFKDLLIFEGCFWAAPYECFAYDHAQKKFFNVSKACGIVCLDKTELMNNEIVVFGRDKDDFKTQAKISIQDIILGLTEHGKSDFESFWC